MSRFKPGPVAWQSVNGIYLPIFNPKCNMQARLRGALCACRDAGANGKLVKLLQSPDGNKASSELSTAALETLRVMAQDEVFRLAFRGGDGLALVIIILSSSDNQVRTLSFLTNTP